MPYSHRPSPPPARIVAVAGTDTEIGKTVVTAALALALRRMGLSVAGYKPFASDSAVDGRGRPFSTDAALLAAGAGMKGGWRAACGQLFRTPVSPLAAARIEGKAVDLDRELAAVRDLASGRDIVLVEGVGGWEAPVAEGATAAAFFQKLGAPVLLVARTGLGTVNHALLTLGAIRARGLQPLGVILNRAKAGRPDPSEDGNAALIEEFGGTPVLPPVRRSPALTKAANAAEAVKALPDLSVHAEWLLRRLAQLQR